MSLPASDLKELKRLGESKRVVVVVLKWRYPFFTKLENFRKVEDAGLVGIFSEQIRPKLFEGYEKHFDRTLWFKADYSAFEGVYLDSNTIEVPEISDYVKQICTVISPSKLRLVETEEFMLDVVCKLRAQHAIPGPTVDQLEHLRNKAVLKTLVRSKGIPTAKFCILEFPLTSDIPSSVAKINEEIGVFPLFRKPVSGCGGGGGGRIENEEELCRWLGDEIKSGNKMTYLVEECLSGREFWASLCLLPNGERRPLFNLHCVETTVREYLESGRPIPFLARRFGEWEDEFPNLLAFVDKVVKAIQAPHPHLLCIQGFQLQPGTDSYLFTECGYRQNGARSSGASYAACGVTQETALLSCHSDLAYRAEPDPEWPRVKQFSLWWPYREGVLRSHNPLPADKLSSNVEHTWLVEPGTKLCKAESFAHFIANARITNKDWNAGVRDLEWVAANWSPDVKAEP